MVGSQSARWELLSTAIIDNSKQYACCKETYQSLTYTFVIQRRSAAAVFTIITPTLGNKHSTNLRCRDIISTDLLWGSIRQWLWLWRWSLSSSLRWSAQSWLSEWLTYSSSVPTWSTSTRFCLQVKASLWSVYITLHFVTFKELLIYDDFQWNSTELLWSLRPSLLSRVSPLSAGLGFLNPDRHLRPSSAASLAFLSTDF